MGLTAGGVVAAVAMTAVAVPAQADTSRVITGVVECSFTPVEGVWVESSTGGSGFAELEEIVEFGGYGKFRYTFTQEVAGSYWLSVGCGGTPNGEWDENLYSDTSWDTEADWACNNTSPWWELLPQSKTFKVLSKLGKAVTTEDVEYLRCKQV